MKFFIPVLLALPLFLPAQTSYYVKQAATGTQTGQSWTDAFTDLQVALAAAQYGDTIRLAEGAYFPVEVTSTDRTATFLLKNGVAILGGYSGNPDLPEERDPATWRSFLAGDIGDPEDSGDNVYNVITAIGPLDERTELNGIEVVGGNANSLTGPSSGGGLVAGSTLANKQNFRVRNCAFFANNARFGGAVSCFMDAGSRPTFEECDFYANSAEFHGGAVYLVYKGPEPIVCKHLFFEINQSPMAPDLYLEGREGTKSIYLSNCTFRTYPSTNPIPSGCYISGQIDTTSIKVDSCTFTGLTGGPFLQMNANQQIQISNCAFTSNKAASFTDILNLWETGSSSNKLLVENCTFKNNSGFRLGYFDAGSAIVRNCSFDNNQVGYALYFENASHYQVENCAFRANNVNNGALLHTHTRGDLLVRQSVFYGNTAILFSGPTSNINQINRTRWEYCTFSQNKWYLTPPLAPYLFNFSKVDTITFNSCLLADADSPRKLFQKTDPGTIILSHSLVNYAQPADIIPNTAVLRVDSTDLLGAISDLSPDLHLTPCSPGLNAGDSVLAATLVTDYAGAARIANGQPDIGAFESVLFVKKDTLLGSCTDHATGRVQYGGYACPPFTYAWSDGVLTGTDTLAMPPGNYALTITAANGITFQDSVTIAPTPLEVGIVEALAVQCAGLADGVASVDFTAGQSPYQYSWSNGQTTPLAFNLPAGLLSLTITDAHGCVTVADGAISGPLPLEAVLSTSPVSTPTASDGAISVDSVRGGMAPYQYVWSNGGVGPVQTGLQASTYVLTLTDANGCQILLTAQVDALVNTAAPALENELQLQPSIVAMGGSSRLVTSGTTIDKVLIFHATGQLTGVLQPAGTEVTLSAQALPAGLYFLQILTGDNRSHTLRWQIQ